MNRLKTSVLIGLLGWVLSPVLAAEFDPPHFSVADLERERSRLIGLLLEPDLSIEQRAIKSRRAQRRLVHLERIALRTDIAEYSPEDIRRMQRLLQHYDLSFLVHASAEGQRSVMDHWLVQMGLTSGSILSARVGIR